MYQIIQEILWRLEEIILSIRMIILINLRFTINFNYKLFLLNLIEVNIKNLKNKNLSFLSKGI